MPSGGIPETCGLFRLETEAVEHTVGHGEAPFFPGDSWQTRAQRTRDSEPRPGDRIFRDHFERRVCFMEHPAAPSLARNSYEPVAIGAPGIDLVVDYCIGRIADM